MNFSDWAESIKNIIEVIAILVGGGWALYRFGLFRERFPSMEISNGINYIGENSSEYLLELYCIVENKGKVRKWLAPLDFELLYLDESDPFERDLEINEEVSFKKILRNVTHYGNRKYWVYPDWYIPFVDGGSTKHFHHLTAVPKHCKYLILNTRFIDFNSKMKAVNYILFLTNENNTGSAKHWNDKSFEERIMEIGSKKSDFYYSQATIEIETIKKDRTQQT
ncbi:MAG: hypothetical protein RIB71_15795 [Imperialibacter sp.]|uniref:hypothetical protein n=1 Tax=Imperialibacter sp. TaxID=2038411 RepID=UPI0032EF9553